MKMTKEEVLQATLRYLLKNDRTQLGAIRHNIEEILKSRGEAGEITTRGIGFTSTSYVRMSDTVAMLVNEVIYDLISERILTPGIDASNLELPFISVTNKEKINTFLR
ncbi:hypothetical protein GC102_36350 [Paenibacillus sp. LMG 31460]|uniref:Uncharacterized protein n=1 Tax=Paenibacillus germinis TaxID=2654979 RepID=A0ABX1ZGW1_9BACL|nr:hypothetical protein [Paenibacillus germinis]NOU91160.1 hypothetical protein [Paenibacillus germinis]